MAAVRATSPARCVFSCSMSSGNERSVEFETFAAHECAEIGPVWHRILPDLVFRPAIFRILAELVDVALLGIGLHGATALVVGRDLVLEPRLVIAIVMDRDIEAQPGAHDAREGR